jgi:hypothetical protein
MAANRSSPDSQRSPRGDPNAASTPSAQEPSQPAAEPAGSSDLIEVPSRSEQYAVHLRETVASVFMYGSLGHVLRDLDSNAYKLFRDKLLADCGHPADPVVVMQIEQLALAHLNIGMLQFKAANSRSIECEGVYLAAAARLMGEFRRSAIALQALRAASIRLGELAEGDTEVPNGEVIEPGSDSEESHIDSEIEAYRGDDDEPRILRFCRRATV